MNENVKNEKLKFVMTNDDLREKLEALEIEIKKHVDDGDKKCACVVLIAPGAVNENGEYFADLNRVGLISNLGPEENTLSLIRQLLTIRGFIPDPSNADLELAHLRLQVLQLASALRAAAKGQLAHVIEEQQKAPEPSTEEATNEVA